MRLRIWYGHRQRVGYFGDTQDDFNLLGDVAEYASLTALTCTVNGKLPAWPLAVGRSDHGFGDGRRLACNGHFNADIPVACLDQGENRILLEGKWSDGVHEEIEVTLVLEAGACALPRRIEWVDGANPQDFGQCVDGQWHVENGALRTSHTGYDRVFLIGNRSWRDYEVTVPVTIHRVEAETAPHSGGNGLGLLFRFAGHVTGGPRRFPPGQPKWGYQPFGAILWLRWMDRLEGPPQKQFYRGDGDGMTGHGVYDVREGATYWMRGRCESRSENGNEGVTEYRFRIWEEGAPEPDTWDFEETQVSTTALREGGMALLAHHVDASFGTLRVNALE